MGDPGLASKFIEMQQEEFQSPAQQESPVNLYRHGLALDRSRILSQLKRATNPNHVAILRRALAEIESKITW